MAKTQNQVAPNGAGAQAGARQQNPAEKADRRHSNVQRPVCKTRKTRTFHPEPLCVYEFPELMETVKVCGDGYVLYRVVTGCHPKRAQTLVYLLLVSGGVDANASYRRRPVLKVVLDMVNSAPLNVIPMAWYFIMRGADPNTRDSGDNTLLHHVAKRCFVFEELVEDLLDSGADPNIRNKQGETPLHVLFKYGECTEERKASVAKNLLMRGADPNIKDRARKIPLDYASDIVKTSLNFV